MEELELKSAGRSARNPATGRVRASDRQRRGLTPPAGWRDEAIPVIVSPDDKRRLYLSSADLWVGYRRSSEHHFVCLLGIVLRWPRKG